jgi:hypothetical protein
MQEIMTASNEAKVQDIAPGELVQRKPVATKLYRRGVYDRSLKRFMLEDMNDVSKCIWVKRDTVLFVD